MDFPLEPSEDHGLAITDLDLGQMKPFADFWPAEL